MQVEVHRTIKNIFKAKREADKIVVLANWLLPLSEIKTILKTNAWTQNLTMTKNKESAHCREKIEDTNAEQRKNFNEHITDLRNSGNATFNQSFKVQHSDFCADMFCGKRFMLCGELYEVCPSLIAKTHLDDNKVFVHEEIFSDKSERLKAIKSFIKRMARIYLSSEVSDFGTLAGLCPEKIDFRELKGEWTKCCDSVKRLVNIDYRVVQLPQLLRRYVIVHTFCHFSYPDHDVDFWNSVSNYLPNYVDYRKQLQQYDFLLEI